MARSDVRPAPALLNALLGAVLAWRRALLTRWTCPSGSRRSWWPGGQAEMAQGTGLTPSSRRAGRGKRRALPRMGRPDAGAGVAPAGGGVGLARAVLAAEGRGGGAAAGPGDAGRLLGHGGPRAGGLRERHPHLLLPLFVRLGEAIKAGQLPPVVLAALRGLPHLRGRGGGVALPPAPAVAAAAAPGHGLPAAAPAALLPGGRCSPTCSAAASGWVASGRWWGPSASPSGDSPSPRCTTPTSPRRAVWLPLALAFGELAVRPAGASGGPSPSWPASPSGCRG